MNDTNPDWLPSLHLGKSKATVSAATAMRRYERWKAREQVQHQVMLEANLFETNEIDSDTP